MRGGRKNLRLLANKLLDFLVISGCKTHFKSELRRNHGQAAYEIFSIERRFQWSKSRFSRFKETCARGH